MQKVGKIVVLPSISLPGTDQASVYEDDAVDENSLPKLLLPQILEDRLMEHQKIGVRWLHSRFLSGSGGILGDDMGMGKTFQVTCLLAGLMKEESIHRVLILAPVSVLPSWQRELNQHLLSHISGLQIYLLNSDVAKKKRLQMLESTFHPSARGYSPRIVISSYQLVSNMITDFSENGKWDYVILDEGHIIKNPSTKTTKSMHMLPSKHRLILTGTPIQNNLNELWTVIDWVTKGKNLGTLANFKRDYTIPIVAGQDPRATAEDRQIATIAASNFHSIIKHIILQRKKCELFQNNTSSSSNGCSNTNNTTNNINATTTNITITKTTTIQLPTKIELVVWVPLASSQRVLYEEFIHSREFDRAVHRNTCPVEVINHLKTVCRHPLLIEALVRNRQRREKFSNNTNSTSNNNSSSNMKTPSKQLRVIQEEDEEDDIMNNLNNNMYNMNINTTTYTTTNSSNNIECDDMLQNLPSNATLFDVIQRDPHINELLRGSIKLRILLKLVHRLHYSGHRILIFSQSKLMLDIIQRLLVEYHFASCRIDGSVKSQDRQRIIDDFNDISDDNTTTPSICLLTTKAGGCGITLTGADRVIIYDPCKFYGFYCCIISYVMGFIADCTNNIWVL